MLICRETFLISKIQETIDDGFPKDNAKPCKLFGKGLCRQLAAPRQCLPIHTSQPAQEIIRKAVFGSRESGMKKTDLQLVGTAEPMYSYMESLIREEDLARGMARQKLQEKNPEGHTNCTGANLGVSSSELRG